MTNHNFDDEDRPRKVDPDRKNRKTEKQGWKKDYEDFLTDWKRDFGSDESSSVSQNKDVND